MVTNVEACEGLHQSHATHAQIKAKVPQHRPFGLFHLLLVFKDSWLSLSMNFITNFSNSKRRFNYCNGQLVDQDGSFHFI